MAHNLSLMHQIYSLFFSISHRFSLYGYFFGTTMVFDRYTQIATICFNQRNPDVLTYPANTATDGYFTIQRS